MRRHLALLAKEPAHGYELRHGSGGARARGRRAESGHVYVTLSRLERRASSARTSPGRGRSARDKHVYELTAAGRERVEGGCA